MQEVHVNTNAIEITLSNHEDITESFDYTSNEAYYSGLYYWKNQQFECNEVYS